jgi:hypothetical protein
MGQLIKSLTPPSRYDRDTSPSFAWGGGAQFTGSSTTTGISRSVFFW